MSVLTEIMTNWLMLSGALHFRSFNLAAKRVKRKANVLCPCFIEPSSFNPLKSFTIADDKTFYDGQHQLQRNINITAIKPPLAVRQ